MCCIDHPPGKGVMLQRLWSRQIHHFENAVLGARTDNQQDIGYLK